MQMMPGLAYLCYTFHAILNREGEPKKQLARPEKVDQPLRVIGDETLSLSCTDLRCREHRRAIDLKSDSTRQCAYHRRLGAILRHRHCPQRGSFPRVGEHNQHAPTNATPCQELESCHGIMLRVAGNLIQRETQDRKSNS